KRMAEKSKRPLALKLEELFGIDLRSLALFRMGLALIVIGDLIHRSLDLKAHYTDFGILPRAELIRQTPKALYFSVHLISGSVFIQAILFLLAGFFAFALF